MRMRKLLVATVFAGGALFLTPGIAAAQEQPAGTTVKLPEANEECIKLLEKAEQEDRRLPEGAEPDLAGDERDHLGHDLLRRPVRPAVEVRVARAQEGPGGAHGADPRRPRRGRDRQGRRRAPARRLQGAAGRRQERVGPHHRGGPSDGRRARSATRSSACRPSSPSCGPVLPRTSRRRRRRPSPTSALRSRRSPSVRPRSSSRRTSTATPRCSSSRTTSTRSEPAQVVTATDDRVQAYADAMLAIAQAEGTLDEVSDELFRFARALEGSDELRAALTDPHLPASRRQQIVEDLLGGKATPTTVALVSMAVGAGRAKDLPAIIDALVARRRPSRRQGRRRGALGRRAHRRPAHRLAAAIQRATGKAVDVKVVIDPTVLGGIVTTVGDTVIDGSVRGSNSSSTPSKEQGKEARWLNSRSTPPTSPRCSSGTSRASSPTCRSPRSGASSRSATASPACRACPTPPSTSSSSSRTARSASP